MSIRTQNINDSKHASVYSRFVIHLARLTNQIPLFSFNDMIYRHENCAEKLHLKTEKIKINQFSYWNGMRESINNGYNWHKLKFIQIDLRCKQSVQLWNKNEWFRAMCVLSTNLHQLCIKCILHEMWKKNKIDEHCCIRFDNIVVSNFMRYLSIGSGFDECKASIIRCFSIKFHQMAVSLVSSE